MSALVPKADIERGDGHVRFVPIATERNAAKSDRYSITLSARARSVAGTATPRITRRQIARVHVSFDNACPLSRLLDHPAVLSHATAAADRLRQPGSRALDKPRALCRSQAVARATPPPPNASA